MAEIKAAFRIETAADFLSMFVSDSCEFHPEIMFCIQIIAPQQLKVRVLPRVPSPHAPRPSVLRRGKFKRSVAIFPIAPRENQPPV